MEAINRRVLRSMVGAAAVVTIAPRVRCFQQNRSGDGASRQEPHAEVLFRGEADDFLTALAALAIFS